MKTIFIVLCCYDYNPGSVHAEGAYTSKEAADTAVLTAEQQDRKEIREVYDSYWVEETTIEGEAV